jgi:hypothetical protein
VRYVLLCLLLTGACAKKKAAGTADEENRPPPLPPEEVKRNQDACVAYVTAVCECAKTVPAVEQQCALARALPEALRVSAEVGMSPDSTRLDIAHARDMMRKTVAQCIEQSNKLRDAGCP